MEFFNDYGNPTFDIQDRIHEATKKVQTLVRELFAEGISIVEHRALEASIIDNITNIFAEERLIQQMKMRKENKSKTPNI